MPGPPVDRNKGIGIFGFRPDGFLEVILDPLLLRGMTVGRDRKKEIDLDRDRVLFCLTGDRSGFDRQGVVKEEIPDVPEIGRGGKKRHNTVNLVGIRPFSLLRLSGKGDLCKIKQKKTQKNGK